MIAVFGGSFNPPTVDHVEIIHQLTKLPFISKILLLPVGNHYKKAELIPAFHRVAMLEGVAQKFSNVFVSDLEVKAPVALKTIESMRLLKSNFPGEDFAFVLGADNLNQLWGWYAVDSLLSENQMLVLNRDNSNVSDVISEKYPQFINRFIIVDAYISQGVSSTMFRNDPTRDDVVPIEVFDYIIRHGLYSN